MAFTNYAPPGVYTQTTIDNPVSGQLEGIQVPVLIGTGQQSLRQTSLEVVRGSSSTSDQRVPEEDMTGRAVVSVSLAGQVTLGDANGVIRRFQVRNYPVTDGSGAGTVTNDPSTITATINGVPDVVLSVDGTLGIVELASAPSDTDEVRITYFFKRTDTLTTDDVSDQITQGPAEIYTGVAGSYAVVAGSNDALTLVVNGTTISSTLPEGTWTASQMAAILQSAFAGVTAASVTNNLGQTVVRLRADRDIVVGSGSANTLLGFAAGQATNRNRVFRTFQGPIVDGSNGGITTTDPGDITVRVNGVVVTATAVDGASRAVTLPYAPALGDTVTIEYHFNAWQDTFDYLANVNVTSITQCGITPGRNDFTNEVDFVLSDDKVVWGSAALVSAGTFTTGSTPFDSAQVSTTLVDERTFLEPCTVTGSKTFTLAYAPTTGNGRGTPLGSALYNQVANGRIDLPTNRPDLVTAYWGYNLQDALDRGPVEVVSVESSTSTVTLRDAIPAGASVWASFYYNVLQDDEYTLTVGTPGPSGVGTYSVTDEDGNTLYGASLSTKGAALATVSIEFPSGSELEPDFRFESNAASTFTGPVEEVVTVQFASSVDSPAVYVIPGPAPYYTVTSASDVLPLAIDGNVTTNLLSDVSGTTCGFSAFVVGSPVVYDQDTGITVDLDSTNNTLTLRIDGELHQIVLSTGSMSAGDVVDEINAAVLATDPSYVASTRFNASVEIAAGEFDDLTFHFTGDVSGASGNIAVTLDPGTYTASTLAAEVESKITAAIGTLVGGDAAFTGLAIAVSANALGQLVFTLTVPSGDDYGYLEFIRDSAPAEDFAVLAGIDTDTSTLGAQTKLAQGSVAQKIDTSDGEDKYDRILIRSRIVPCGNAAMNPSRMSALSSVEIVGGTAAAIFGLEAGTLHFGRESATVRRATVYGSVGLSGGQAPDGMPAITFYDGTGANAANNVLRFLYDGTPITVTFSASDTGTLTALGTTTTSGSVLYQIADAMVLAGLFANVAAVNSALVVRMEGAGVRIVSGSSDTNGVVQILDGSANSVLGLSVQTASRTGVPADAIVSALMSQVDSSDLPGFLFGYSLTSNTFPDLAVAFVQKDTSGSSFVGIQSLSTGATAVLEVESDSNSAFRYGTGLLAKSGDVAYGEDSINGFYVTSSDPNGSGSADTSYFNGGTGQDGIVGQTYRDAVTGLTFTILPREGGLDYPTSGTANFKIRCTSNIVTNANVPTRVIPGVQLLVTNTSGTASGDSAIVETFRRSGAEPAIGDIYYVSYTYEKSDYTTRLYSRLNAITDEFGPISVDNPVSLAASLMFLNGGVITGITQVPKAANSSSAPEASYVDAVDSLAGALPGQVFPTVLVPLTPATQSFATFMAQHCDLQSSIRYRAERTAILGFGAGTVPSEALRVAAAARSTRVRVIYPDIVRTTITNATGRSNQVIVDGRFLAAALAGFVVSPNFDVATPWTNRQIVGIDSLGRTLDPVQMNQLAVGGVTVLTDDRPFPKIRHGVTTDMSSQLTSIPTVIQIADEVQRRTRANLDRYIGTKFLPTLIPQIEGRLSNMFKGLVRSQIVISYKPVQASVDPNDPTSLNVEGAYNAVLPLLWIIVNYALRGRE